MSALARLLPLAIAVVLFVSPPALADLFDEVDTAISRTLRGQADMTIRIHLPGGSVELINVADYETVIPHHSVVELTRPGVYEQISLGKADRLLMEHRLVAKGRSSWTLHVYYY